MAPRLRLTSGLRLLDEWSEAATQADRNAVYEVLFAVADKSIYESCDVIHINAGAPQIMVIVNVDLVTRIWLHDDETFGIAYIGPFSPNTPVEMGMPGDEP